MLKHFLHRELRTNVKLKNVVKSLLCWKVFINVTSRKVKEVHVKYIFKILETVSGNINNFRATGRSHKVNNYIEEKANTDIVFNFHFPQK